MATERSREELLAAMDREGRRLGFHSTMHNHACAALVGLHPTDWAILDVLGWAAPTTAGQLARHLGLSNGAITGALDRLERSGHVRRQRDPRDRRRVYVEMVRGREPEIAAAARHTDRAMAAVNARLDDEQLAVVLDFLQRASAALEESTRQVRADTRAARRRRS